MSGGDADEERTGTKRDHALTRSPVNEQDDEEVIEEPLETREGEEAEEGEQHDDLQN